MSKNPRLIRAVRSIERRMFLKALGVGLAVPAALRLARVATAAAGTPPKRFFLFFMPHGVAPEHYDPRLVGGDPTNFALDQTNVSILGPLQPYKQYVNVYQGFQYPGAAATHTGIVNCLSGSTSNDTTTPRTTVEQVIGKALGVKPLILGACSHLPYGMDSNGMLFWDGTPIDPQKSPVAAFDALFGNIGPTPPVDFDVQLRKDLLALDGVGGAEPAEHADRPHARAEQAGAAPDRGAGRAGRRLGRPGGVGLHHQADAAQRRDGARRQRRDRDRSQRGQ